MEFHYGLGRHQVAIKPADFVRINYRARFSNGWVTDNEGQEPIEFMQGDSGMPGVDAAILGREQGEELTGRDSARRTNFN